MSAHLLPSLASPEKPLQWLGATSGNAHTEIKRDIGEFMRDTVEPNSPYKALDGQLAKPHCVML